MKKLYTLLAALVITASTFAQAPEGMSYQAVVRDSGNAIVGNQAVGMQLSILQGSTAVYVETQTPMTNANGLVSIALGTGSVVSGTFATIDWSAGPYFIKTETDPTGPFTNYTITGTSQMLSVPYALHAKTAESITGTGNTYTAGAGIDITNNVISSKATYRWTSFSTYNQAFGWYANNDPNMFGGIPPSVWSDANGMASNMSSDKQVLLTLFNKKAYSGNNAVVFSNEWGSYSSTNGKFAGALFRIENTTGSDIVWNVEWFSTAYGAWGERSSVTINGANTWNSGSSAFGANHHESTVITIPANRVSTIIFIAGSSLPSGQSRGTYLAFDQNCLNLPVGLIFIDDLDTAPNGWGF